MARRKLQNNFPDSGATVADGQKLKTVVTTEKFLEPMEEREARTQQTPPLFPELVQESDADPLDRFLDNLDAEQGVRLRVDLLTEYHLTGKSGRTSPYTYCGEFPVSKDALDSDQYLQMIQSMFGGGNFRLTLRGPDGRPITSFVKSIKAAHPLLAPTNPTVQAAVPVQPGQSQPQQSSNYIDDLIEQAAKFEKLKKVLGFNPEPAAAAAAPQAKDKPLEEKISGLILDKILESKDENLTDKFIARYLGEDKESDFSWRDVAKEVIMPLVPVAVSLASAFLGNRPTGNGAVVADATPAPQGDLSQPQLPAPPVATDTQKLLGLTRQDCLMAMPVERTAVAFDVLTTEENQAELQAIFSQSPQEILERLQIPVSLERVQWIQELQAELKGEAEEAVEVVQ